MTAEIAILNRAAVAIAADSAVTLAADQKVYKTANKVFPLSLDPPVVIMFYGAGSLGPIPWETIVQEYRRRRHDSSFGSIEEYGDDLMSFLPEMVPHISQRMQSEFVRREILCELEQISRVAQAGLLRLAQSSSGDPAVCEYFIEEVRRAAAARSEYLTHIGPVAGIPEESAEQQLGAVLSDWEFEGETVGSWQGLMGRWFSRLPELLSCDVRQITRALGGVLKRSTLQSLRTADWSPGSTGMVITGFGREQLFPSLTHWLIDQVMDSVVKTRHLETVAINDEQAAVIYPLAQQHDVARTLIDGIHPEFLDAHKEIVFRMMSTLVDRVAHGLQDMISSRRSGPVSDWLHSLPLELAQTMPDELEMRVAYYSAPFIDIVEGLPKEHLAEMAETLVHLASFKEKFTPGADFVGGPIDVAVISRGDGLTWVKHKQYS